MKFVSHRTKSYIPKGDSINQIANDFCFRDKSMSQIVLWFQPEHCWLKFPFFNVIKCFSTHKSLRDTLRPHATLKNLIQIHVVSLQHPYGWRKEDNKHRKIISDVIIVNFLVKLHQIFQSNQMLIIVSFAWGRPKWSSCGMKPVLLKRNMCHMMCVKNFHHNPILILRITHLVEEIRWQINSD